VQGGRAGPAGAAGLAAAGAADDDAAGQGVADLAEGLLDYDVIEAFCVAGLRGRASSARGTCRSALYRLAAGANGLPGQRPTPFPGARPPPHQADGPRVDARRHAT
jgi:hypothetical protein